MNKTEPESRHFIKQRYQDTSVVIFKEQQKALHRALSNSTQTPKTAWDTDLTDEASSSTYCYCRYGNEAVIVHQDGNTIAKKDMGKVQSAICVVM